MKRFFKGLNLARGIMLLALVGSLVLGWMGWKRSEALDEMLLNRDHDVPKLVREIEQLGRRHTQLAKNLDKEGLKGQANLDSYIRAAATADKVDVGEMNLSTTDDHGTKKGIIDRRVRIKPNEKDVKYVRSKIANFLYKLEEASRRVKVTDITMTIAEKKVKPADVPDDLWTFDCEVTSRQRTEQ